ncbi:uncharacterized protein CG3556-like [Uloborus diversus]|uniref:uncharacterized protein CG3556-like n=1 Tax=Uloborus diversus TaxID=327109 RepID=UPI0024099F10|nr:uncharacterized protein CG3556-like [Uloborus diversus]
MDGPRKSHLIRCAVVFFLLPALVFSSCPPGMFQCLNGKCIDKGWFCDNQNDCGDNSDEYFCSNQYEFRCPPHWMFCGRKCYPPAFRCDGKVHCDDQADEKNCENTNGTKSIAISSKHSLVDWFLRRRENGTTSNKWGHELPRTAVALFLSDPAFFAPGNLTAQEMAYELTIQLLSKFSQNRTLSSADLALYINAMLVTCIDPRNFHGHDLVSELRKSVEEEKFTNPFEIIALCNAGDTMTSKDVGRILTAYNSEHRPFWIDIQALSAMALVCLSQQPTLNVEQRNLRDMVLELKKLQHLNGTVENLRTTAVVLQVLNAVKNFGSDFDYEAAIEAILQQQKDDGSFPNFLDSYYILPALSNNSLVSINTSHCQNSQITGEEALKKLRSQSGKQIQVHYSVFVDQDMDFVRTWKLKVPVGSTLYNVMETIQELDDRFRVQYNVFNGKPYPYAMFNLEDDPESGLYWFVYKRSSRSNAPQLMEASPVDIQIRENEELILWYRNGHWNDHQTALNVTSTSESP